MFAPAVDEVYPGGDPQVRITAGPMGERLEGATRPGHFDGMLTVVAKLLHLTRPDLALFGQKDAQQLALIRRMVTDLNFPVEVVGVPTVREEDGLALSSRNRYLSAAERRTALALSRALFAGRDRLAAQAALRARAEASPASDERATALARLGEIRASADAHAVSAAAAAPGCRTPYGPPRCTSWTRRAATSRRSCWTTWRWWTRWTSPRPVRTSPGRPCWPSPRRWARPG